MWSSKRNQIVQEQRVRQGFEMDLACNEGAGGAPTSSTSNQGATMTWEDKLEDSDLIIPFFKHADIF